MAKNRASYVLAGMVLEIIEYIPIIQQTVLAYIALLTKSHREQVTLGAMD